MSGRLEEKKIQEIVKTGKTATISNYFSKHSGSQKHYVKNYTEKKRVFKCKYIKNRIYFKLNYQLNCK